SPAMRSSAAPCGTAASWPMSRTRETATMSAVLLPGLGLLGELVEIGLGEHRSDPQHRRYALDDPGRGRHGIPAGGRKAIGFRRCLRLVEHHEDRVLRIVHREGADERGEVFGF